MTLDWPSSDLESVLSCPICHSTHRHIEHSGLKDYFFESAPGEWNLYRCEQCRIVYLDPRPTSSTIGRAYEKYYTHKEYHPKVGALAWIWHVLRNDYLYATYGANCGRRIWLGRLVYWATPLLRQGMDAAIARNMASSNTNPGRVLDVGCGNGTFLKFARLAGWETEGIDPDPTAIETARRAGLKVHVGTLSLLDKESERYDWITASHVIEHVYAPRDLILSCHRLLKPGGILWIETPNIDSCGHSTFGEYWRGLEPPRHLQLFNNESLRKLLADCGFKYCRNGFSSLANSSIWRDSQKIVRSANSKLTWRKRAWGAAAALMRAKGDPNSREFITLICTKVN